MIRRSFLALTLAVVAAPAWAQFDTMTQKPIVAAVRSGDEEKVRQALLKGENANQIDASGRPLLMIAVMDGDIPVVQALLKGGYREEGLDTLYAEPAQCTSGVVRTGVPPSIANSSRRVPSIDMALPAILKCNLSR